MIINLIRKLNSLKYQRQWIQKDFFSYMVPRLEITFRVLSVNQLNPAIKSS